MELTPSVVEIILAAFVISDFFEKGFEALSAQSKKLWLSAWNIYDVFTQVVFVAGFLFRIFPNTFRGGKILYAGCAMLFCCRLFRLYYIHSRLGPMILIFIYMMPKMLEFLAFLALLLVGFGIASKALMTLPCDNWNNPTNFWDGIFTPYWQMFGELQLDELEKTNWTLCQTWGDVEWLPTCKSCDPGVTSNNSKSECLCKSSNQGEIFAARALLSVYLIVSNILLINLIIAIFTHVFEQVQLKSSEHWKFEMYRLTREYERRPALPPPIAPFVYIWRFLKKLCSLRVQDGRPKSAVMENTLRIFEQHEAHILQDDGGKISSQDMTELSERLRLMEEHLAEIKNKMKEGEASQALSSKTRPKPFEEVLKNHLAPVDKLVSLPKVISLLEEHLRASQKRLEDIQAAHGQELKAIRTTLDTLARPNQP